MKNTKECRDHLGNIYASERAMCAHYGVSQKAFRARIKRGWNLKDALTKALASMSKECEDHLGNKYKSKSEMCRAWGVNRCAANVKLHKGTSLKNILDPEKTELIYKGKKYKNITELASAVGLNSSRLSRLIKESGSTEAALKKALQPKYNAYLGKTKMMRCGLNLTIKEKAEKGYIAVFEDGTEVHLKSCNIFARRNVSHPTFRACQKSEFAGFTTSRKICGNDDVAFFMCRCKTCGYKDVLTPQQMLAHAKIHPDISLGSRS